MLKLPFSYFTHLLSSPIEAMLRNSLAGQVPGLVGLMIPSFVWLTPPEYPISYVYIRTHPEYIISYISSSSLGAPHMLLNFHMFLAKSQRLLVTTIPYGDQA